MGWIGSLTTSNWIAIAAVCVAVLSLGFTAANYLAGRRERERLQSATDAEVKATINRTHYGDGWRSVQLHIAPAEENPQNWRYESWVIERAQLMAPRGAILARAENDDYASRVFYPENPLRVLAGKGEGRVQRFALEFFIKFTGEERGQTAKFKVTYARADGTKRRTVTVSATVSMDAE